MDKKTTLNLAGKKIKTFFGDVDNYLKRLGEIKTKIKGGKDSKSLVTQADIEIQEVFDSWLNKNFKGHTVLSEEKNPNKDLSDWVWYIDPIDGTTLFSRGIEEWGIIICLTYQHEPLSAWIYFPYSKTLFYASKDEGAFKNGSRIYTSKIFEIKKSIISSVYLNSLDREEIMVGGLWNESLWGIIGRSLAKDFCNLAEGKIDIAICYHCYSWEYKALSLLIEEAGGICTTFNGKELNEKSNIPQNLIATANKHLSNKVIKLAEIPPKLL